MLVAHLSDLHVFAEAPEVAKVRADIAAAVAAIVADLERVGPDLVAITGDLCCGGRPADHALLARLLAPLGCPVLAVPGNHDRRAEFRRAFAGQIAFAPGPFAQFATDPGGLRVVGLDSVVEGEVHGALCPERLAFAEAALAGGSGPVLLLIHHPPFATGNAAWDAMGLREGAAELGRLVAGCGRPVHLLCGHVHRPMQARWAGAWATIGGSPAFGYALGIGGRDEPALAADPRGYFLHEFGDDGAARLHFRWVEGV